MINPIFRKEVKTLFRSWKIFTCLSVYVLLLTAITALFLFISINSSYNGFDPQNILIVYFLMSGFQVGVIILTVPAFTSNAISGERERQTFDLMLITKVSNKSIIIGKLMSSLIIVLFIILVSMPVYAIIFYYGGISVSGFLIMVLFSVVNAMSVGSISIFFSTIYKKTIVSIISSHALIYFFTFGTMLLSGILYSIWYINFEESSPVGFYILILSVNPFWSFISIVDSQVGTNMAWEFIYNLGGYSTIDFDDWGPIKIWHFNIAFNILITVIFTYFSTCRITIIKNKNKTTISQTQNNTSNKI